MRSQDIFRINLRRAMAEQGLKVKDLADMVGLSPSYLSLILSGERQNLSDYHKDALAMALGTTVAALYTPGAFGPAYEEGTPERGDGESLPEPSVSQRGTVRPSGAFVPAAKLPGRDIGAFEDFLRALNVRDDVLTAAYYRELSSLSDDEIRRFGEVIRRVINAWQARLADRRERDRGQTVTGELAQEAPRGHGASGAKPEAGVAGAFPERPPLSAECRILAGLVGYLAPILGDVPLEALEIACGWPKAKVYRLAGTLEASGAISLGSGSEDSVTVRLDSGIDPRVARSWIRSPAKEECLGRFAAQLSSLLEPIYEEEAREKQTPDRRSPRLEGCQRAP